MSENTLSGCLAGFLQNPPPALRQLALLSTHLQTEDIESLTAAVTAGKLQHLEEMILLDNHLSHAALGQLLHALLNTVGDRNLTFKFVNNWTVTGIIITPSENNLTQLNRIGLEYYSGSDYPDSDYFESDHWGSDSD